MLTLYITRHGETEWNLQRRMQGWMDSALTPKGIRDAVSLGERLKDVEFKAIYSSSSKRTLHTAELIRRDREVPIIPDNDLREIHLGEWEGKSTSELEIEDTEEYRAFWKTPHQYKPKSGESFYEVHNRVKAVLDRIITENTNGNVLIVTHAVVVKIIMSYFKGLSLETLWEPPFVHGTSLCVIENAGGVPGIVLEGDISHLSED